ncbi:hypothetical protein EMN47_08895 [Prolixibacteraceae bacterium JC049]|nr:hypothetical protein [Prolixibacteraceae bacterium JC049]
MKQFIQACLLLLLCLPNISYSQRTILTGRDNGFGSLYTHDAKISLIDGDHFIVVWKENSSSDSDLLGRIGQIDAANDTITYGPQKTLISDPCRYPEIISLSSSKAVLFYESDDTNDIGYSHVVNFTTSNDSITSIESAVSFSSGDILPTDDGGNIYAEPISSSSFLVSYSNAESNNQGEIKVGTVSGNSISYGSAAVFDNSEVRYQAISLLTSSKFAVTWGDNDANSNEPGYTRIGNISGTSITYETTTSFYTASGSDAVSSVSTTALNDSTYVIVYADAANSNYAKARVAHHTNSALSFGDVAIINDNSSCYDLSSSHLENGEFIIAFYSSNGSTDTTSVVTAHAAGDYIHVGDVSNYFEGNKATNNQIITFNSNTVAYLDILNYQSYTRGSVSLGTLIAASVWTGTGQWHDASKWQNGVPGDHSSVIIQSGTVTVGDDALALSLTIKSGATVDVSATKYLNVSGALDNQGTASALKLNSTSSGTAFLINNTPGVSADLYQYITGAAANSPSKQWHYFSKPISETIDVPTVFTGTYVIQHSESDDSWSYLSSGNQLSTGKGYGVWELDATNTIQFLGTVNTGDITVNTDYTNAEHGWNFIGNPYPCPINWDEGITRTNVNNATYIFDKSSGNYASYVNGTGTNGGTKAIASMQGFFVRANATDGSVKFTNTTKYNVATGFKSAIVESPQIQLKAKNDMGSDELVVRFNDSTTEQFDAEFDAFKLFSSGNSPKIYTLAQNEKLSINSLPTFADSIQIPMEYIAPAKGKYHLKLKSKSNLNDTQLLLIKSDNTTIEIEDNEYSFETTEENTKIDFTLKLIKRNVSSVIHRISTIQAYAENGVLKLSKLPNIKHKIDIYNSIGQLVHTQFNDQSESQIQINHKGVFIVVVSNDSKALYQEKVVIQ